MKLLKNPALWVGLVCLVCLSGLAVYFSYWNHEKELECWSNKVCKVAEGGSSETSKTSETVDIYRIEIDGNVNDGISGDPRLSSNNRNWLTNPERVKLHVPRNNPGVLPPQTEFLFASRVPGFQSVKGGGNTKKYLAYTIQTVPAVWSFHRPLGVSLLYVAILAILWVTTWSADRGKDRRVPCAHFLFWGSLTGVCLWTASTIMSVSTLPPDWPVRYLGVLSAGYLFVILLVGWLLKCFWKEATAECNQEMEDYLGSKEEFPSHQRSMEDLHRSLSNSASRLISRCNDAEERCAAATRSMDGVNSELQKSLSSLRSLPASTGYQLQTAIEQTVRDILEKSSKECTTTSKEAAETMFTDLLQRLSEHLESLLKVHTDRAEEGLKAAYNKHANELDRFLKAILREAADSGSIRPQPSPVQESLPLSGPQEDVEDPRIQQILNIARDSRYPLYRQIWIRLEGIRQQFGLVAEPVPRSSFSIKMCKRAELDPVQDLEPALDTLEEIKVYLHQPEVQLDVQVWTAWGRVRPTDPDEEWHGLAEYCLQCLQASSYWSTWKSDPESFENLCSELGTHGIVLEVLAPGDPRPEDPRDWKVHSPKQHGVSEVVDECISPCIRVQDNQGRLRTYIPGQASCVEAPAGSFKPAWPGEAPAPDDGFRQWLRSARESVGYWKTGTVAVNTIMQYSGQGNPDEAIRLVENWFPWTKEARELSQQCDRSGVTRLLEDRNIVDEGAGLNEADFGRLRQIRGWFPDQSRVEELDWRNLAQRIGEYYNSQVDRLSAEDASGACKTMEAHGVRLTTDAYGLAETVTLRAPLPSEQDCGYQSATWRRWHG